MMRPDVFVSIEVAAIERGLSERDRGQALCLISKIVLHTGKDVDQLSSDDVLEVFAWSVRGHPRRKEVPGLHTAWDLLRVIRVTPAGLTLPAALRRGQRPTTELVDDDDIRCRPPPRCSRPIPRRTPPRVGRQLPWRPGWCPGRQLLG